MRGVRHDRDQCRSPAACSPPTTTAVWRRRTLRRMVQRIDRPEPTDEPGVLFLQIDGLSETVLRRALGEGYLPTLARWVALGVAPNRRMGMRPLLADRCEPGRHPAREQREHAGVPLVRQVCRARSSPPTARTTPPRSSTATVRRTRAARRRRGVAGERVLRRQPRLAVHLQHDHRPRTDARATALPTSSPIRTPCRGCWCSASPTSVASWRPTGARSRRRIEPRGHRGGVYPLLRVGDDGRCCAISPSTPCSPTSTAGCRPPMSTSSVTTRSLTTRASRRPTRWRPSGRLDQQFARLERAISEAPRPVPRGRAVRPRPDPRVRRSLQRYGETLADVRRVVARRETPPSTIPQFSTEGWGNLNGILSDTVQHDDTRMAKFIKAVVKRRTVDGEVVLGPGFDTATELSEASDVPTMVPIDRRCHRPRVRQPRSGVVPGDRGPADARDDRRPPSRTRPHGWPSIRVSAS